MKYTCLTDVTLYLITVNRAFCLEKNNKKNKGYEARRKQECTHTHTKRKRTQTLYEQKQQQRDENNLFSLFFLQSF